MTQWMRCWPCGSSTHAAQSRCVFTLHGSRSAGVCAKWASQSVCLAVRSPSALWRQPAVRQADSAAAHHAAVTPLPPHVLGGKTLAANHPATQGLPSSRRGGQLNAHVVACMLNPLPAPWLALPSSQVLGNKTLAALTPPRASHSFGASEVVTTMRMWASRRTADGTRMSPLLARLELETSSKAVFKAGPELAEAAAVPVAAHAVSAGLSKQAADGSSRGSSSGGAEAAGEQVAEAEEPLVLKGTRHLGSGIMAGAAAYSSHSAIHAFGLLFLQKLPVEEL